MKQFERHVITVVSDSYEITLTRNVSSVTWVEIKGNGISEHYVIDEYIKDKYRIGKVMTSSPLTDLCMEYDKIENIYKMLYPNEKIFKVIIDILPKLHKLDYILNNISGDK